MKKSEPLTQQEADVLAMMLLMTKPMKKGETWQERVAKIRELARKATKGKREYRQLCKELGLPREGK